MSWGYTNGWGGIAGRPYSGAFGCAGGCLGCPGGCGGGRQPTSYAGPRFGGPWGATSAASMCAQWTTKAQQGVGLFGQGGLLGTGLLKLKDAQAQQAKWCEQAKAERQAAAQLAAGFDPGVVPAPAPMVPSAPMTTAGYTPPPPAAEGGSMVPYVLAGGLALAAMGAAAWYFLKE